MFHQIKRKIALAIKKIEAATQPQLFFASFKTGKVENKILASLFPAFFLKRLFLVLILDRSRISYQTKQFSVVGSKITPKLFLFWFQYSAPLSNYILLVHSSLSILLVTQHLTTNPEQNGTKNQATLLSMKMTVSLPGSQALLGFSIKHHILKERSM